MRVYKYKLENEMNHISIPMGGKPLHVAAQDGCACIWVEVDEGADKQQEAFEVYGTGHLIKEELGVTRTHVGTAIMHDGYLVLHVYQLS